VNCPACRKPLIVVERQGIEVDWCAGCGGIWFDAGELELLAEAARREFTLDFAPNQTGAGPVSTSTGPSRDCPRCDKRMDVQRLAGEPPVEIDLCPRGHGVWLDRGELSALLRSMPETAGDPATKAMASFLGEVFRADAPADIDPS